MDTLTKKTTEKASRSSGNREALQKYLKALVENFLLGFSYFLAQRKISPDFFKVKDLDGQLFQKLRLNYRTKAAETFSFNSHIEYLAQVSVPMSAGVALQQLQMRPRGTNLAAAEITFTIPRPDTDFVFSYPLPTARRFIKTYEEGLALLFLETGEIYENDERVHPDSFGNSVYMKKVPYTKPDYYESWGDRSTKEIGSKNYQPLHTIAGTEPGIMAIAWHWALLVQFFEIADEHGNPVVIDGFRLRRTRDWVVSSGCRPSEVYEYLARICNVACKFCYLFGNPDRIAVARGHKSISQSEIETRLKYWDPQKQQVLFHSQWEINEFLVDPKLPEVLRNLRSRTDEPFFFITNGNPLIPRVIDLLAEVKPVNLIISANTFDGPLRSEVMGERILQTRTALSCMESLQEKGIPFGISLVAFPEISHQSLEDSLKKLIHLNPAFVRINMPGFTSGHPYKFNLDTDEVWGEAIKWIRSIRENFSFPILSIPAAYEENNFNDNPHEARILGTVIGSPAAKAGLLPYDIITSVNGFEVTTRMDALNLLRFCTNKIRVQIIRRGKPTEVQIDATYKGTYPYTGSFFGKYTFPHGVVASFSLSGADAEEIEEKITTSGARQTWVLTSSVMYRGAQAFINEFLPALSPVIRLVKVENDFLGGNIRIMDMATVGDMVIAVQKEMAATGITPDLVLLPSSGFNKFGRDLSGKHWTDIEHHLSVPVKLLVNQFQFPY